MLMNCRPSPRCLHFGQKRTQLGPNVYGGSVLISAGRENRKQTLGEKPDMAALSRLAIFTIGGFRENREPPESVE